MVNYVTWITGFLVLALLIGFSLLLVFGPGIDASIPVSEQQQAVAAEAVAATLTQTASDSVKSFEITESPTCTYYEDQTLTWNKPGVKIETPPCLSDTQLVMSTITRKCVDEGCTSIDGTPMAIGMSETRIVYGCKNAVAPCQKVALLATYILEDGSSIWWSMVSEPDSGLAFGGTTVQEGPQYNWYAFSTDQGWIFYNASNFDNQTGLNRRYLARAFSGGGATDIITTSSLPYYWNYPSGNDTGPAIIEASTSGRYMKFDYVSSFNASLTSFPLATDQLVIVSEEGFRNFLVDFAANFGAGGSQIMKPTYLTADSSSAEDLDRTSRTNVPPGTSTS